MQKCVRKWQTFAKIKFWVFFLFSKPAEEDHDKWLKATEKQN